MCASIELEVALFSFNGLPDRSAGDDKGHTGLARGLKTSTDDWIDGTGKALQRLKKKHPERWDEKTERYNFTLDECRNERLKYEEEQRG